MSNAEHYLKVAKKCGASTLQEHWQLYPYRISFGHEEFDAYNARICTEKDEVIDALGQQLEATRRHALKLDDELAEANSLIAMQAEALKHAQKQPHPFGHLELFEKAISASVESIAAWEKSKLLPLQRQVAMLVEAIYESSAYVRMNDNGTGSAFDVLMKNKMAVNDTQATAEVYDRELTEPLRKRIAELEKQVKEGK